MPFIIITIKASRESPLFLFSNIFHLKVAEKIPSLYGIYVMWEEALKWDDELCRVTQL